MLRMEICRLDQLSEDNLRNLSVWQRRGRIPRKLRAPRAENVSACVDGNKGDWMRTQAPDRAAAGKPNRRICEHSETTYRSSRTALIRRPYWQIITMRSVLPSTDFGGFQTYAQPRRAKNDS